MRLRRWAPAVLALAALFLAAFQDMSDQDKTSPYPGDAPAPLPGTVPRETALPVPALSLALVQRGQQRFDIECAPCHGRSGAGNGMVVQRGFPQPPDLASPALVALPSRQLYDVIGNGYGAMYGFAGRIAPQDRWAIVAYLRALQQSQSVDPASLTPAQREQLK
ncbi:MAG TPA: cytochrome c [Stellaceae bacterium]|jgi:mono/diheme cytochrome c family protein|nr:cytochrome c [Stellaceae bacterium]